MPTKRTAAKKGGRKWVAGAIKHPGALHRDLGIPGGEPIPAGTLAKVKGAKPGTKVKSGGKAVTVTAKIKKRANLATTLKKF